ncbi:hypothetical protein BI347_02860 [Chromobacterium sphagni]|uniref:GGDEF domain-containing protein n=2 Tax=Chromobacterium sphagni TaxID=1903179 RepID=A0A1S1WZH6_9NEIS|nr:sensor domain-containing diguanylate cyclase [Chromobacterium sphagni]OHX12559.1 hypothetical protein BI347_02860 [Chromobacterium sphagni]OHX21356.1 hypothetical protein BI344_02145 [Chromobacterium sphagni]
MQIAPLPVDENDRVASLRRMQLLCTPDEQVFDQVVRVTKRLFDIPIVLISLVDENSQWFKSCIGLPMREIDRDVSFCSYAILGDQLFIIPDATRDDRFADNPLVTGNPHVIFYAGRPLKNVEGYRVGTLCLIDHHARVFSEEDQAALHDLGNWVELAFLNRELSHTQMEVISELDQIKRKSMLDAMLNVWNRAAGMEILGREIIRLGREDSHLALLMIDLDYFKQINDQFGHPCGDQALIEFAKRICASLRSYDSVVRYGGDEFMVILPGMSLASARERAQHILDAIRHSPLITDNANLSLSASIGVSAIAVSRSRLAGNELIHQADDALLKAKRAGRGRVEVFADG